MLRTLVVGTAVAGALTFGSVGIAGATTSSTPPSTAPAATPTTAPAATPSTTPAVCAKLPTIQSRVQKLESTFNARLPKVQAREAKLTAAGKTKRADALKKRVTRIQTRESKVNARLSEAEAKCGTTTS